MPEFTADVMQLVNWVITSSNLVFVVVLEFFEEMYFVTFLPVYWLSVIDGDDKS